MAFPLKVLQPYIPAFMFFIYIYGPTAVTSQYCSYVMQDDYKKCWNRTEELATFKDSYRNRIYNESTPPNTECQGIKTPCRKLFNLGCIHRQSFGSKTRVQISDMLDRCCGPCTKYFRHYLNAPLAEMNFTVLRSLDIIYPVSFFAFEFLRLRLSLQ